jgi:hypothetical protein
MRSTSVRKWYLDRALDSFAGLRSVLPDLTEKEVLAALELEAATLRRQSVIDRLISRAVRIREQIYASQLKEKFHGTSPIQSPVRNRTEGRR